MAREPTMEEGVAGPAAPASRVVLAEGIHTGIPAEVYHSDPAPEPSLSSSIAAILADRTPAHAAYAHPRLNPNFTRVQDRQFDIGIAAHALLIEGKTAELVEAADWKTKAARERRAEILAAGKLPLLVGQGERVHAMVMAARQQLAQTEEASDIFEDGEGEVTVLWQESCWCRIRPDLLQRRSAYCWDYKTCANASVPHAVARHLYAIGADIQSEFYRRGLYHVLQQEFEYRFICQEVQPPYALSVAGLSPQAQDLARGVVDQCVETWTRCLGEGKWPSYPARTSWIDAPGWIEKELESLAIQRDLDARAGVDPFALSIELYRP